MDTLASTNWPIRRQGDPEYVLLISCASEDDGGGLFCFDGKSVEQIDRLSSAGLLLHDQELLRILYTNWALDFGGEIVIYDSVGVKKYFRLDNIQDAHYLDWDGENYVIVSTWNNRLVWMSPAGEVVRTWQAPGEPDAMHLNGVFVRDGELYLSAFGEGTRHRSWKGEGEGFVQRFGSGEKVLKGLTSPHNPMFFDGAWHICNSSHRELLQFDDSGKLVRQSAPLDGWTRGLAHSDDYLFVGESALRRREPDAAASVAVLSKASWEVLGHVGIPAREISDLAVVPVALVAGLRRGFRTNPQRAAEQDQYYLFDQVGVHPKRLWVVADALPPEECRVTITAEPPAEMETGVVLELDCTVTNHGGAVLVSAAPYPVHLSYRWLDAVSGQPVWEEEPRRSRLLWALPPGESRQYRMVVKAPSLAGGYHLRITLVQEQVAWFDDISPSNHGCYGVRVVGHGTP